jgi:hypothetical protein
VIVHVVLFSPKPDLQPSARRAMLDALVAASADIPSIRRFRVGRRVTHSLPGYEQMMRENYEFAAVIEFDDLEGLKTYLRHPSHADIGRHFAHHVGSPEGLGYTSYRARHIVRDISCGTRTARHTSPVAQPFRPASSGAHRIVAHEEKILDHRAQMGDGFG